MVSRCLYAALAQTVSSIVDLFQCFAFYLFQCTVFAFYLFQCFQQQEH